MAAGDLCVLADVKALLPVAGIADDTVLGNLITQASDAVKSYLSQLVNFTGAITQTIIGRGEYALTLAEEPVTSVTSVTFDGTVIPQRTNPGGSGWYVVGQQVFLSGFQFYKGCVAVVVYQAGYGATPPTDYARAAQITAAAWYKARPRLGLRSEGIGGTSMSTYDMSAIPPEARQILDQRKQVVSV